MCRKRIGKMILEKFGTSPLTLPTLPRPESTGPGLEADVPNVERNDTDADHGQDV